MKIHEIRRTQHGSRSVSKINVVLFASVFVSDASGFVIRLYNENQTVYFRRKPYCIFIRTIASFTSILIFEAEAFRPVKSLN